MTKYRVFLRRPWKRNPAYPQGWEPFGGARKRTLERGLTLDEARRRCATENEGKPRGVPGQTWCEFEAQS
jgi:hypothetical protein